jgi:TRAP-type C4-dicarboxylate transport system permease small subunit
MIWIGVLGAAYVSGRNLHVAIDILPTRSSEKTQKRLRVIVNSMVILFVFFAFVVGGSRLVYISYVLGQQSPALQLPLAVVYIIIPISGLLIMYYKSSDLKKGLS